MAPAARPKTVLRSVRIPASLETLLRADAESKGISVNALISAALTKYAEWDRFTERFGFVTITKNGYRILIDNLDDAGVERTGREMGSQNPREMALFWFKKLGLDAFLDYLSLVGRYGKWVEVEIHREGRNVTVLLHHDIGPRYSAWLGAFMAEAVREVAGAVPRLDIGRGSVVVRFAAKEHAEPGPASRAG